MTAYGAASYTYGPSGDLRTRTAGGQTTTYSYDALGNLMGAWLPDGRVIEYVVDGLNRRVGKKVNGTVVEGFLYDGQLRPVAWLDATGAVKATFVYGLHVNVPEYMTTSAGTFRFIHDHLGSPRLVVDTSSGAVVQRMDYDSFGQVLQDTSPGFQPFGFAGGLYDRDTGLVKFGARDYDASVGRWTNKDPLRFGGGDTNLYLYVGGDPVNWTDPSGLYIGQMPPPPPGYDPWTWTSGQWDNGRWWLKSPDGRTYTAHPEDAGHWRHWDDDNDDRWPPNSKKPRPNQKKPPYGGQCATDPSGDAPGWRPPFPGGTPFDSWDPPSGAPVTPAPGVPPLVPVPAPFPVPVPAW
jgi:RHS repeat-associated protein